MRLRRRTPVVAVLFLGPAVLLLSVFRVWPMVEAFRLSLTEWRGFAPPEFVGFANYAALVRDPAFINALVNNGLILLAFPVWIFAPFVIASLLHGRIWGWRVFRMAFFLPAVLSPVIIGIFFEAMLRFDGPVNIVLRAVGLGWLAKEWLVNSSTAFPVLVAVIIWSSFGIGVLLFLAALGNVNPELYDAANVDGVSWLQMQRHVVFPEIRSVVEFWSVIVLISSFTALLPLVFTLTGGGPGRATEVVDFYIYQQAFESGSLGYASAVGVVLFLVVLLLVIVQLWLFRRKED